jgi:hypothetical protein
MRPVHLLCALLLAVLVSGCNRQPAAMPVEPSPSTSAIAPFSGTWTSTASTGVCSGVTYTVAPTGATTANITYSATCAGVPVTGTGTGNVTGTTMNWTTTGNAGGVCPFTLSGAAVPDTASTMRSTYTGVVCGTNVSGSDTLRR